jgi:hypothetical protein
MKLASAERRERTSQRPAERTIDFFAPGVLGRAEPDPSCLRSSRKTSTWNTTLHRTFDKTFGPARRRCGMPAEVQRCS